MTLLDVITTSLSHQGASARRHFDVFMTTLFCLGNLSRNVGSSEKQAIETLCRYHNRFDNQYRFNHLRTPALRRFILRFHPKIRGFIVKECSSERHSQELTNPIWRHVFLSLADAQSYSREQQSFPPLARVFFPTCPHPEHLQDPCLAFAVNLLQQHHFATEEGCF